MPPRESQAAATRGSRDWPARSEPRTIEKASNRQSVRGLSMGGTREARLPPYRGGACELSFTASVTSTGRTCAHCCAEHRP